MSLPTIWLWRKRPSPTTALSRMIFQAQFFDKAGTRQATDNKHFRQHEYDWYAQDTWKVRRNLTLTLGLRYQLDGVPLRGGRKLFQPAG